MGFEFNEFADSYLAKLRQALDELPRDALMAFWQQVETTRSEGGSVHFIGNGGSGATASHSAGDWSKELSLRTISHTDSASAMTAWANDTEYSNVFVGQLSTFVRKGDLVVGYSGSGNSENVVNGIHYANDCGCRTTAITGDLNGMGGGKLAQAADVAVIAPANSMEMIEDIQLIVNHIIKEAVKAHHGP